MTIPVADPARDDWPGLFVVLLQHPLQRCNGATVQRLIGKEFRKLPKTSIYNNQVFTNTTTTTSKNTTTTTIKFLLIRQPLTTFLLIR
jgi:hypothetical protein